MNCFNSSPEYPRDTPISIRALSSFDVGTSLGYSGDELKQFINDERMRMDREKEEKEKLAEKRGKKKENDILNSTSLNYKHRRRKKKRRKN